MQSQRLYEVVVNDSQNRLFKEHTEVKLTVKFATALTKEQRETFRQIVSAWGLLGQFAPMPLCKDFDIPSLRELTDREKRFEVFRGAYMKYCWAAEFADEKTARIDFDLWSLDQGWIEVLLNCLEAYHAQVTPIEQIEFKPAW